MDSGNALGSYIHYSTSCSRSKSLFLVSPRMVKDPECDAFDTRGGWLGVGDDQCCEMDVTIY